MAQPMREMGHDACRRLFTAITAPGERTDRPAVFDDAGRAREHGSAATRVSFIAMRNRVVAGS